MERQSLLDSYEIEREVKGETIQKDKERVGRQLEKKRYRERGKGRKKDR